jgi:streptogramin lyase
MVFTTPLHRGIAGLILTAIANDRRSGRRVRERTRIRPKLEGLEDRSLLSITEFPVPTPGATPWSIAAGPDGNLWFTERDGNKVGMINPTTHAVSEFPVPTANSWPIGITVGPDGNVWFTEAATGNIGVISPTTHSISEFPTHSASIWPITSGPDGNLWLGPSEINPTTHVFNSFGQPTPSNDYGIAAGADSNLWFTEYDAGQIGMINPTTHAVTEFPIPRSGPAPDAITAGPDGNLWFTDDGNNGTGSYIGTISPTTHAITEFPATPYGIDAWDGITTGPDGNLWFTDNAGAIETINPTTHVITSYVIPYTGSSPLGITSGPDGNIWFADQVGAIGVDYLKNLVVTAQPPASVTAGSGFGLTVQARDASGNLITSFNGTVTLALGSNPGGSTLGGTLSVTASAGIATFSGLTLTRAASGYTIVASTTGLGQSITSAITVTPAAASQLAITQQPPTTVKLSSPFALKASIEDVYGNVVTTASGTVSVAFASNPTGATLGGTLTVTASQGVASFTNLTINKVGSGYTLRVSSSGLTSAVSNSISVTKSGKAPMPLSSPAGVAAPDLALAPLVLDRPDLWDGVRPRKRFGSIFKSV